MLDIKLLNSPMGLFMANEKNPGKQRVYMKSTWLNFELTVGRPVSYWQVVWREAELRTTANIFKKKDDNDNDIYKALAKRSRK